MDSITVEKVSKRFGGVQALDNVSFGIRKGEVHAIVGENGAGKSTLMKLIGGIHVPDTGRILLEGQPAKLESARQALDHGISIVHQELNLFPQLSVTANLFLGRERLLALGPIRVGRLLDRREMRSSAREALIAIGASLSPDTRVADLSMGEKQLVEIARAFDQNTRILILDEPNSALNEAESARLFSIIRGLKSGGTTILFVSHRLDEVFSISDRVTVLRDGHYQGTWPISEMSIPKVVEQMIGHAPSRSAVERGQPTSSNSAPLLAVRDLTRSGALGPVSFEVRPGEILGFAGLEGAGIDCLFRVLFGLERPTAGQIEYGGKARGISSPSRAIRGGWGMIPASRRDEGLMMAWPIRRNTTLLILDRLINRLRLIKNREATRLSWEHTRRLNVQTDSVEKAVIRLSGGNQQKVLLAKWLAPGPRVLLLNDPTRGVDVGAKAEIHGIIRELAARGLSILVTSSEIEETLELSHRVIVLRRGKVVTEFASGTAEKPDILHAMSGL